MSAPPPCERERPRRAHAGERQCQRRRHDNQTKCPVRPRPPTVPYPDGSRAANHLDGTDLRCAQRGDGRAQHARGHTQQQGSEPRGHRRRDAGGANEPNPSAKLSAAMALNSGTASRLAGTAVREPIREPNRLATPTSIHMLASTTRAGPISRHCANVP